jgi:hypothetical protein
MNKRQLTGLAGATALAIGVFVPLCYHALWLTGLASLALIGYSFMRISSALASLERELADNPFRGLANAQMQWGWALLGIGAILLLAAAATKDSADTQPTSA